MKKATIASLLMVSAFAGSSYGTMHGQAAPAAGQVTMDPAEFTDYDAAMNKQTTPQTQAPALEAYLVKWPKSAVKADVLQKIMFDYYQFDHAKAIDAADKVLQVNPSSIQAYVIEVAFRGEAGQNDAAADYAQKGLNVTTPAVGTSEADFAALKTQVTPTFYSAIGTAAMAKKDYPGAIAAFKSELSSVKIEQTTVPGTPLQDTFNLGQAYYSSSPADYVNCTFYITRAASYAPDTFKDKMQPLATYCYKKYHGGVDGYDAVVNAAKANLNPPAGFSIVAAPTNEDLVKKTIAETPDLSKLALSDKEFILTYGKSEDAEKVFATVKAKETELPEALVVKATPEQLQLAVSEDAVQSKVADFTVNMKTPLTKLPEIGSKMNVIGTYKSYTQTPLMIIMDGGSLVPVKTKAPAAKAPVKKAPARRR